MPIITTTIVKAYNRIVTGKLERGGSNPIVSEIYEIRGDKEERSKVTLRFLTRILGR